jgi:hypothetical protein
VDISRGGVVLGADVGDVKKCAWAKTEGQEEGVKIGVDRIYATGEWQKRTKERERAVLTAFKALTDVTS